MIGSGDPAQVPDRLPVLEISRRFVAVQKKYFGKGPSDVQTMLEHDVLLVVMRGGLTPVERTLAEGGMPDRVLHQRRGLQQILEERYKEIVVETTGREVEAFMSANSLDPVVQLEIFLLR
jgi:uncharacterized protein YbcI